MRRKALLLAPLVLLAAGILAGLSKIAGRAGHEPSAGQSFQDGAQVLSAIHALPPITAVGMQLSGAEWAPYLSLGKRIRDTEPGVVISALRRLSASNAPVPIEASIRVALLLRVCFECPSGTKLPQTHGGWVSASAAEAGRSNLDANWPVACTAGRLYLTDGLNGYLGRPYDPASEFQWRLANCAWRRL